MLINNNSVSAGYVFMHELSRHVCSCMCTAVQGDPKVTQIFQLSELNIHKYGF